MITLQEVLENMRDLRDQYNAPADPDLSEDQVEKNSRAAKRELKFLDKVRLCLEKEPTKEFMQRQLQECEKHIAIINRDFDQWQKANSETVRVAVGKNQNIRSIYNNEMNMKHYKDMLELTSYILQE